MSAVKSLCVHTIPSNPSLRKHFANSITFSQLLAERDEKFTLQTETKRLCTRAPVVVWAGSVPLSPLCGSIRPVKGTYTSAAAPAAPASAIAGDSALRETSVLSAGVSSNHAGKRFTVAAITTNKLAAATRGAKRPREVGSSGRVIRMIIAGV